MNFFFIIYLNKIKNLILNLIEKNYIKNNFIFSNRLIILINKLEIQFMNPLL
jgi:hypothetical protein